MGSTNKLNRSEHTHIGSQSSDPNDDALTYEWTQTSGSNVILNNADTSTAMFTAPSVSSDTMLQFELTVSDPSGLADSATTIITILKEVNLTPNAIIGPTRKVLERHTGERLRVQQTGQLLDSPHVPVR